MHELSIVTRLLDQITGHTPPGAVVKSVHLRVGVLQAIEPQAMQWAWRAATTGSELEGSTLHVESLPWKISCPQCGRTWDSHDPLATCDCGNDIPHPSGDHELTLVSLDVEHPHPHPEQQHKAREVRS